MKLCKMSVLILAVMLFSSLCFPLAASADAEYEVSLDSPTVIEGAPLYETDYVFTVTNTSGRDLTDLVAYLSYMDVVDGIIYDDEFGDKGEKTVRLDELKAGESVTVTIPLKIIFAGEFRITASVVDLNTGAVATSDTVTVTMTRITAMRNTLVICVAVVVPVVYAAVALVLTRRKSKKP